MCAAWWFDSTYSCLPYYSVTLLRIVLLNHAVMIYLINLLSYNYPILYYFIIWMLKSAATTKRLTISDFTPDVIGLSILNLVYRPKCSPGVVASSWEQSAHFSFGVSLSCRKCNTVWMICKDCSNINSYLCFGSQMFQHYQKKHIGGTPEKSK